MAEVLIIEDEPVLRSSMAKGLSRMPGVTVAEAGTVGEAVAVLDASPPRLILSDIDLPDRSGLEILGEIGKRSLRIPVVFISAYLKAYSAQIPRHADVDVREKPVGLEELRNIVAQKLGAAAPAEDAEPFNVADFVQLACLGQRSVVVQVAEAGANTGSIVVHRGEAWAARDGRGTGQEAFYRLAMDPNVSATCRTLKEAPGDRNLFDPWEMLLLDAARLADETAAGMRDEGSRNGDESAAPRAPEAEGSAEPAAPQAPPEPPDDGFDDVWDRGVSALLARDYHGALAAFLAARDLRPKDGRVIANLDRLSKMGYGDPGNQTPNQGA